MFNYIWRNWTLEFVQCYKKFVSTLSNVLAITIFFQLVSPIKHSSSYRGGKNHFKFAESKVWIIKGLSYQE